MRARPTSRPTCASSCKVAASAQCRSSSTSSSGVRSATPRRKPAIASNSRNCASSESAAGGSGRFGKSVRRAKMRWSSTAYGSHSLRRISSGFRSR